jgi:hypothetical protein
MSTKEAQKRIELLQGTLDLLILRTLLLGPAHGHTIAKAIEFRSDDSCRSNRVLSIRLSIASSSAVIFLANRARRKTIAAPNSTNSPPRATANSQPKPTSGRE